MSVELLDEHVPGWKALTPMEFRWAVNKLDALIRPSLREAHRELTPTPAEEPPAPLPPPRRSRRFQE